MNLELHVQEEAPLELHVVEAKIKPEQDRTVTPDYDGFTVFPDPGTTLGSVKVNPIPDPTEVKEITANGNHDVRRFGTARVEVPQGVFPAGTRLITANGMYDISEYEEVEVDVSADPTKGFVLDTYDDDGYPTRARFVGNWTAIPNNFLGYYTTSFNLNGAFYALSKIKEFVIPDSVITLGLNILSRNPYVEKLVIGAGITDLTAYYTIRTNDAIKTIVYRGNLTRLNGGNCLQTGAQKEAIFTGDLADLTVLGPMVGGGAQIELYDFSHTTVVFALPSASYLPHANGCVIRVPQELLSEWQAAPIWNTLTDVVWESV